MINITDSVKKTKWVKIVYGIPKTGLQKCGQIEVATGKAGLAHRFFYFKHIQFSSYNSFHLIIPDFYVLGWIKNKIHYKFPKTQMVKSMKK